MSFYELCEKRQSCRSFAQDREIEREKLYRIIEAGRLSPSACNGQPYLMTLVLGNMRAGVVKAVTGMGMNKFTKDAAAFIVISEEGYVPSAALGAKVKGNDYRSIDIGILAANLTLAATEEGVGSCILGWLDDGALRELLSLDRPVRLVIALGYPSEGDKQREKKRKPTDELLKVKGE